jgi:hypothetical protein
MKPIKFNIFFIFKNVYHLIICQLGALDFFLYQIQFKKKYIG